MLGLDGSSACIGQEAWLAGSPGAAGLEEGLRLKLGGAQGDGGTGSRALLTCTCLGNCSLGCDERTNGNGEDGRVKQPAVLATRAWRRGGMAGKEGWGYRAWKPYACA